MSNIQEKNKQDKFEVTLNLEETTTEKKTDISLDEFLLDWNSKLKDPYDKTLIAEITKNMNKKHDLSWKS